MISLVAHELCWINGASDDPDDQCAHGRVTMSIDGVTLVRPDDGEWTVSTAALYLLRTLTGDYTPAERVAESNFLFPCCGFSTWQCGDRYEVICMGCCEGIDVWIRTKGSIVEVSVADSHLSVSRIEWRAAVLGFAKNIEQFYAQSSPKIELDDRADRDGWAAFWAEWRERVNHSLSSGT